MTTTKHALTYAFGVQMTFPGIDVGATGAAIDEAVEPSTVAEAIRQLDSFAGVCNWVVGDLNLELLARIRAQEPGWHADMMSLDQPHTVRCMRVAANIDAERRHPSLSWSHHDLVAAMASTEQDRLLAIADTEGLTHAALKALITQERQDIAGQPELADMPLRPWKPSPHIAKAVAAIAADNPSARVVIDLADGTVETVA